MSTPRSTLRLRPSAVRALLAVAAVALLAAGCGSTGPILGGPQPSDPYPAPGGTSRDVVGEIDQVDTSRREITVRDQGNRLVTVGYAANTQVVYQGQNYDPSALERGDYVSVDVREDSRGYLTTDYIRVEQSRQDRTGGGYPGQPGQPSPTNPYPNDDRGYPRPADIESFSGTVGRIDLQRGRFDVRSERHGLLSVRMPYDVTSTERNTFERLRPGDQISFDAEWLGDDAVELVRFTRY